MKSKLLIVHPSKKYDYEEITRIFIIGLTRRYSPADIFVIDNEDDYREYLKAEYTIRHLMSPIGEIKDPAFLEDLLENCEELTICGHIQNNCHHTSFEDAIRGFEDSDNTRLNIVIPTYAVSSDLGGDTGKTVRTFILEMESSVPTGITLPSHLSDYKQDFCEELTPRETATLVQLLQYIKFCLSKFRIFSLKIEIDGKMVFANKRQEKQLKLTLQNKEPLPILKQPSL